MDTVDRLEALLPGCGISDAKDELLEIRLRVNRPVQLVCAADSIMSDAPLPVDTLNGVLSALMDYSLYTREDELKQGFFTLRDGSRVGVCGRMAMSNETPVGIASIGSVCVRVAREIKGCADGLMERVLAGNGVRSMLLVSPPGMGKTTMLRDIARQLSLRGYSVAIADERHELAACCQGVPTTDVGPCTDVMDGCPKQLAIGHIIRSMAPDVIVTDEIGDTHDARALADASRCGIAVIASAHGGSFESLRERSGLKRILDEGVFNLAALLDRPLGTVREIRQLNGNGEGGSAWKCA